MNGLKAKNETGAPSRPPGTEKVWAVVESAKQTVQGKPLKFSIQEIPEDRYEEVVHHLCTYFIHDEPTCQSFQGEDDRVFVEDFRKIWRDILKQRLSVAAFAEDPNGGKPIIAGVNMLGLDVKDNETSSDDMKGLSPKTNNLLHVLTDFSKKAQVYEKYGVDRYMFAFGLSVHPSYRGESLGGHILKARENIGREYNIPVTSTAFTSPISQKLAARCGFEVLLEKDYDEIFKEDGTLAFPGIKVKTFKIMAKRLY